MKEEDVYKKLFGFGSSNTFYSWKKDPKRKIMSLISKFFSKEDLETFLKYDSIPKFEQLNEYNLLIGQKYLKFYDDFIYSNFTLYFDFINFCHDKLFAFNSITQNTTNYSDSVKLLSYEFYAENKHKHKVDYITFIVEQDPLLLQYIFSSYNTRYDVFYNYIMSQDEFANTGDPKLYDSLIVLHHKIYHEASKRNLELNKIQYILMISFNKIVLKEESSILFTTASEIYAKD